MKTWTNDKGFRSRMLKPYAPGEADERLITESTMIGEYEDAMTNPGSSYLWIGRSHHLNREEVCDMIDSMIHWIEYKRLPE